MSNIIFRKNSEFSEKELLYILELCQELLPPPEKAYITLAKNVREESSDSFVDENILKAFKQNKYGIEYVSTTSDIRITKEEGAELISIPLVEKNACKLAQKRALRLINNFRQYLISCVSFKNSR